jgi:hypothetical protein
MPIPSRKTAAQTASAEKQNPKKPISLTPMRMSKQKQQFFGCMTK